MTLSSIERSAFVSWWKPDPNQLRGIIVADFRLFSVDQKPPCELREPTLFWYNMALEKQAIYPFHVISLGKNQIFRGSSDEVFFFSMPLYHKMVLECQVQSEVLRKKEKTVDILNARLDSFSRLVLEGRHSAEHKGEPALQVGSQKGVFF